MAAVPERKLDVAEIRATEENTTKTPERDFEKLSKEQEVEDAAFLANLDKEAKEFSKVSAEPIIAPAEI